MKRQLVKNKFKYPVFFTFVALLTCLIIACGTGTVKAEALSDAEFDVITENGTFAGINLKDDVGGSLRINIPPSANATSSSYGVVTVELGEVDRDLTTGLLIKLATPDSEGGNPSVRMSVEDANGKKYYFAQNSSQTVFPYVTQDGNRVNMGVSNWNCSVPASVEAGTLCVTWDKLYLAAGNPWSVMGSGVKITKLHLAMDMRSSASGMWNRPLVLISVAAFKVSESGVTVDRLVETKNLTVSETVGDTEKEINVADKKSGTKIHASQGLTGAFGVVDDESEKAKISENFVFSFEPVVPSYSVALRFEDANGEEIKERENRVFKAESVDGEVNFEISVPSIQGYEFKSASAPLSGTLTENTEITLTYEPYENYEVITEGGEFVGIKLNESMYGTLQINIPVSATATDKVLGVVTFELGDFDIADSTGLLLKFATLGTYNRQIRPSLEDDKGNLYFLTETDGTANMIMIRNDGMPVGVSATNWSIMLPGNTTGTLYIPWERMCYIRSGWKALSRDSGVTFRKLHVAIDMRANTAASWNLPVVIGAVATANVTGTDAVVTKLLNTGELSYSAETGETSDVNLTDKTTGKVAYSRYGFVGGTMSLGGEENDVNTAIGNFVLSRYSGIVMTVRYVNESGTNIRTATTVDLEYGDEGAPYAVNTDKDVTGYTFVSADRELSGTVLEDFTITLTYRIKQYRITLEFVDLNGKEIKESRFIDADYQSVQDITLDEIDGYVYDSNSMKVTNTGKLSFTVVRDLTIRIAYAKQETSGCNSGAAGAVAILSVILTSLGLSALRKY